MRTDPRQTTPARLPAIAVVLLILFSSVHFPVTAQEVLSRNRLIELVRTSGHTAKISALSVQIGEWGSWDALASFLPTISATASYTHLDRAPTFVLPEIPPIIPGGPVQMGPQNLKSAGIAVYQPIFTGGRIWNARRIADHSARAQRLTHEQTLRELEMAALRLFWGYVASINMHAATVETRAWLEQLVSDQDKLFQVGLIIEHDLLTTRTQLSSAQLEEIRAVNRARSLADQLIVLAGLPAGTELAVDTSLEDGSHHIDYSPPSESRIELMIAGRSDIGALNTQVEALRCLVDIRKASYVPTLGAFYNLSWSNQNSASENDLERTWNAGAALSWTILDWGKAWIATRQAQAQMDMAQLQLDQTRERLRAAYGDIARRVDESRVALSIAHEGVENARRALDIARVRYEEQMITNSELLSAGRELTLAKIRSIAARIEAALVMEEYRIGPPTAAVPQQVINGPESGSGQGTGSGSSAQRGAIR